MMKLLSAEEMRQLDRRAIEEYGIPSLRLMDCAAQGIVREALELLPHRMGRCAILCGSGNNGGDGIAAAWMLRRYVGVQVRVFLVGRMEKMTPDALAEKTRLEECGGTVERFSSENEDQRNWIMNAQVVIDAIFGMGLSRNIEKDSPFAAAIAWINQSGAKRLSVDIPSGINGDSGQIMGCAVKADRTITFTEKKVGHACDSGYLYSGETVVWDIGIPKELLSAVRGKAYSVDAAFAKQALPARKIDGHKGDFGKVMVVGGTVGFTGAPYLCASGAVHSGCGLVYLGVPSSIYPIEAVKCVCAMPFPLPESGGELNRYAAVVVQEKLKGCHVLALGPGLGRSPGAIKMVHSLLKETDLPVVLDADGINALEGHIDILDQRKGRVTILTPHDGEFARLAGDLRGKSRIDVARQFAVEHGCVLVLKGHRTFTATPYGTVLVNTNGNSGLARGGSGDVLTGIIASLLAQGASPVQAAAAGVWIHGRAGDLAERWLTAYAMTPEDVIGMLGEVFRELEDAGA